MENPWELARTRIFNIHPQDEDLVKRHNGRANKAQQIQRALPPVPFIGNPRTARVILLGKNPAYSERDEEDLVSNPELETENFKALTFESRSPFFYLDPAFEGMNGYLWWREALQGLLTECEVQGIDADTVLSRIAVVQWHPYHSKTSFDPKEPFRTQEYGFHLVQEAATGAWGPKVFVIQYGIGNARLWRGKVPELSENAITLNSAQSPHLSRTNLAAGDFDRLVAALKV